MNDHPKNERVISVTFRATEDMIARIDEYAGEERRSRSDAIRMLLEDRLSYLDTRSKAK